MPKRHRSHSRAASPPRKKKSHKRRGGGLAQWYAWLKCKLGSKGSCGVEPAKPAGPTPKPSNPGPPPKMPSSDSCKEWANLTKTEFRKLFLTHHPDKGGMEAAYLKIRECYEKKFGMSGASGGGRIKKSRSRSRSHKRHRHHRGRGFNNNGLSIGVPPFTQIMPNYEVPPGNYGYTGGFAGNPGNAGEPPWWRQTYGMRTGTDYFPGGDYVRDLNTKEGNRGGMVLSKVRLNRGHRRHRGGQHLPVVDIGFIGNQPWTGNIHDGSYDYHNLGDFVPKPPHYVRPFTHLLG